MISLEKWQTLSKRDQIGHIAAEIKRAVLAQKEDQNLYLSMIERAMDMVDLSLSDSKWKENPLPLLCLKNELSGVYLGKIEAQKVLAIL